MNILLVNDDGINSLATKKLIEILSEKHKVFALLPSSNRSGASHSITVFRPFKVTKVNENVYSVDATPVDCVKIAVLGLIKEKIDLVVSGPNIGPNLGLDIYYSGTFSAAREASLLGIHAISSSINLEWGETDEKLFMESAFFLSKLIDAYPTKFIPPSVFPNVNIPKFYFSDIKAVRIGKAYERYYFEKTNIKQVSVSENEEILEVMLDGGVKEHVLKPDSDICLCKNGYISYTMYSCFPYEDTFNFAVLLYDVFRKALELTKAKFYNLDKK